MRFARFASNFLFLSILVACSSPGNLDRVALEGRDLADAERELYPALGLVHAGFRSPVEGLDAEFDRLLTALDPMPEGNPQFRIRVTAEADVDAGCMAGGLLFVTEGLLAHLRSRDELTGALAVAMQQCPMASRLWRQRDKSSLEPLSAADASFLEQRYRNYRLPANAAFYRQLTLSGCGESSCLERVSETLDQHGSGSDGLLRLAARLQRDVPDSAWLARTGVVGGGDGRVLDGDGSLAAVLGPYHQRREGLDHLARARHLLISGELREAYRANLRARRELANPLETELMQVELDLTNFHPDNAQRILNKFEVEKIEIPQADFWWGWTHLQLKRRFNARDHFEQSIEVLPRVDAHYHLGGLLRREGELGRAAESLRRVAATGSVHPSAAQAELLLEQLERR